jgi:hypothetical protein
LSLAKAFLSDSEAVELLTVCQRNLSHLMGFNARIGTEKMQSEDPILCP